MFPFEVYSQYEKSNSFNSSYHPNANHENLSSKIDSVCKNIANTVFRSSKISGDTHISQFSIPKDVAIFGGIILAKLILFKAYKTAKAYGIDVMDI